MMVGSLLGKELQTPPVILPQLHEVGGIVLVGNDRVGRAVGGNQKHTGLDSGQTGGEEQRGCCVFH